MRPPYGGYADCDKCPPNFKHGRFYHQLEPLYVKAREVFPDKNIVLGACFVAPEHPLATMAPRVEEPAIVEYLAEWGARDAASMGLGPEEQPWCRTEKRSVCVIGPRN